MAVAHWVELMGRDVDEAVDAHREALLKQDLEDFARHVLGYSNGSSLRSAVNS